MADMGGTLTISPAPGATVTVTIDASVRHILAVWTAGQAETINISGTPLDGQLLTMIISNDGVLGRLLTFGTGLSADGTLLGIVSKKSIVKYIAWGGTFYEIARKTGVLS